MTTNDSESTTALARPGSDPPLPDRISSRRLTLYAVLIAAAGFVPVPIVDDLLPRQLLRHMVLTAIRTACRTYPVRAVAPLYQEGGCLSRVVELLVYLPLKLLLYPIRKIVKVVQAVRGLSQRTASTYLLGHSIARALAGGWLPEGAPPERLAQQAALIRAAFDQTLERVSPMVFSRSVSAVLTGLRGLGRGAYRAARALLRRRVEAGATPDGPAVPGGPVGAAVDGIQAELASPTVAGYLAEFDREFDRTLEGLARPGGTAPGPAAAEGDAPPNAAPGAAAHRATVT